MCNLLHSFLKSLKKYVLLSFQGHCIAKCIPKHTVSYKVRYHDVLMLLISESLWISSNKNQCCFTLLSCKPRHNGTRFSNSAQTPSHFSDWFSFSKLNRSRNKGKELLYVCLSAFDHLAQGRDSLSLMKGCHF